MTGIAATLVDADDCGVAAVLIGAAARARAEHGYHGNAAPTPVGGFPDAASDPGMDLPGAIALAAQGLSNPDIAARLYISRGTVKTHLAHVYAKLGVVNRTDLARLATLRDQAH